MLQANRLFEGIGILMDLKEVKGGIGFVKVISFINDSNRTFVLY